MTKWHIYKYRRDWIVGTRGVSRFPISYVFATFEQALQFVLAKLVDKT